MDYETIAQNKNKLKIEKIYVIKRAYSSFSKLSSIFIDKHP